MGHYSTTDIIINWNKPRFETRSICPLNNINAVFTGLKTNIDDEYILIPLIDLFVSHLIIHLKVLC